MFITEETSTRSFIWKQVIFVMSVMLKMLKMLQVFLFFSFFTTGEWILAAETPPIYIIYQKTQRSNYSHYLDNKTEHFKLHKGSCLFQIIAMHLTVQVFLLLSYMIENVASVSTPPLPAVKMSRGEWKGSDQVTLIFISWYLKHVAVLSANLFSYSSADWSLQSNKRLWGI